MKKDKGKIDLEEITSNEPMFDSEDFNGDQLSLMALSELTNLDKIKLMSRINPTQVAILTKLYTFGVKFNSKFAVDTADTMLQLQVSIYGYGRRDMVQTVQRRGEDMTQETRKMINKNVFR